MSQHVLVTGAGGFSGRHIVEGLLAKGHHVTAVLRSGRGDFADGGKNLAVVAGDLSSDIQLPSSYDAVVHAAARSIWAGVTVDEMVRDNVLATRRLIDHARRAKARRFIFLSSLSVYGRIEAAVVDETTPVVDPNAYGLTKRLSEEMLAAEPAFSSLAIRLPGVVGPGSVRNWLTNVAAAAREGREISVFNPQAAFNNAVHISDLVAFAAGLLERDWKGADVVTIAAGGQTTVAQAAGMLVQAHGGRSKVLEKPAGKPSFIVSSARAQERYGYRPTDISELLRRLAAEKTG